jgi:putative acetyltransferase
VISEIPLAAPGPVGVHPRHQGRGVGSALMRALIGAAEALDEPALVLLGSPDFYGRFGFVPASSVGIQAPEPAWGAHFQVLPLSGFDRSMTGRFRYAAPFDGV